MSEDTKSDEKTLAEIFTQSLEYSQFVRPVNQGGLWIIELPGDVSDAVVDALWNHLEKVGELGISVVFVSFPLKAQVLDPPDGSLVVFSHSGEEDEEAIQYLEDLTEGYQETLTKAGKKVKVELLKELPQVWTPNGSV